MRSLAYHVNLMEVMVFIALLLPGLSFLIFIVACLLVHHREVCAVHRDGICDRCNHDLTGSSSDVCPECGALVKASNVPIQS